MIQAFQDSPLLLLFVVIGIGYAIGNVSILKAKLGVAAVLFVGLAFGALDESLAVPDIIITFGLAIFVYTIGLANGPGFFHTIRKSGFRDISFFVLALLIYSGLAILAQHILGLNSATTAGLVSGSVTSTSALAGLLDVINTSTLEANSEMETNSAVIGYSLAYPMGVLGGMFSIAMMSKLMRVDYKKEEIELQKDYPVSMKISRKTIALTKPELDGKSLREIFLKYHKRLVFGRMSRGTEQLLPTMDTVMKMGDQIIVVGNEKIVEKATDDLGVGLNTELDYDRSIYNVRRVFISNPELAGASIASLNISEKFSAVITRIQRGDSDLLASGETILELGDRILIVAKREDDQKIFKLFGNSYEAQSKVNLFSFGLGMALGLLIGMINIQLPGGLSFKLGFAGGPLIVALILGYLRKTGNMVWTLPYSANLTIQQIGLILLLAGIGIQSGHTFKEILLTDNGGLIFLAAGVTVILATSISLFMGYKFFKIPYSLLSGMLSHQPAILDFAMDKSGNKLPSIGFTLMLPIALILKIFLVQLLYLVL